jgi:lipoprotein Spr
MKNIVFILTILFFSLAFLCADAQRSSKKWRSKADSSSSAQSPQFINNIELVPAESSTTEQATIEENRPVQKTVTPVFVANSPIEKCSIVQFKYAILTDREVELLADTSLYNFIDAWMGTRYGYGGSTKDGIDCSSFASKLMQEIYHLSLPRTAKEQYDACEKITKENLQEGDLVFFNTLGGISHVGVYLGNNYFVHSSTSSGVMISNLEEAYYNQRFISGGRPD